MEMNLESIVNFVNEKVEKVDFAKLLREADGDDSDFSDNEDLGGGDEGGDVGGDDDFGGDDLGDAPDGDFGGGDMGGGPSGGPGGPSGDSGEELGDEEDAAGANKFADREDDPDFVGGSSDSDSAAEGTPAGGMIYDTESVLKGINSTISSSDINLAEIDNAKNVLEVIANGKKLKPEDFEDVHDYQSFSDIVNRSLFQTDENTQNYFKMKIKRAILDIQNQKKIDASKNAGEVDTMRDLASKF